MGYDIGTISTQAEAVCPVPDFLLRNLDADLKRVLEARAEMHGRSLSAEIRAILEENARSSRAEFLELVDGWQAERDWPDLGDPSALIREDRDR